MVKTLHVTGQVTIPEADLIAAAEFRPGPDKTLGDLQIMVTNITNFYSERGYFVARAYLPPQDITDGVVTIAVIEGRYGKITLDNQTNVSDRVIYSILDGMNPGDPVNTPPLERRLLLISDLPGVEVKSTLIPGAEVGTSDLVLNVKPGQRLTGSLEASNWGNAYTGNYLFGGTLNVNEPLGFGDILSLRALASTTGGLAYGRVSYQAQLNNFTVGVAYTALKYRLGRRFESLDANGTEQIASVYASYPLIRSYNTNLNALVSFEYRTFQDNIGATATTTDRRAEVVMVGLNGEHRDRFGGGGLSSFYLTGSFGNLEILSTAARATDGITARSNGQYAKLAGSVSRLQNLWGPFSLYGGVRGQFAGKNLDISEKMALGGPNAVRAYPEGEAYGDQGYVATLEARYLVPDWATIVPGQVQLIAFVDTGHVSLSKSPWFATTNQATRSGAGVGVNWYPGNGFTVNLGYAHKLGNARATSTPDAPGQFWVRVVKYF